mgnify:CR=1 FL=1
MSATMKDAVIVCHSSWPKEKLMFWHDFHKQRCPNVKMVQAIPPCSDREPVAHEDFTSIKLDPRILFMCCDFFWFNWLETKYEYFMFMEHDCFMIHDAMQECINHMRRNKLECLHAPYQDKEEHRKEGYYANVSKAYGIHRKAIRWCLPNAVLMTRKGLERYRDKVINFAGSEMTVANVFMNNGGGENPFISILTNRSGILREYEWKDSIGDVNQRFYHSVKDYNNVVRFTGFGKEYDKKALGAW